MATATFSNHSALRVEVNSRNDIRRFFIDVLGGTLMRAFPDKDDIRLGKDFYIAFLYAAGSAKGADKGANYAADAPLSEQDFLKAIFLELKTDDVETMRRNIVSSPGVTVLEVPDSHLYFQAPGGQVFRLVGEGEDLSTYEGSA